MWRRLLSLNARTIRCLASRAPTAKAIDKISKLRTEILRLNDAYYAPSDSKGAPASDAVYDTMVSELRRLEQKHQVHSPTSPTEVVGAAAATNALPKVAHVVPMLSLANAYSGADLVDFHTSVSRAVSTSSLQYVAELKYDGMAAALIYQNGALQSVLSRGDGRHGEDITAAALKLVDLQYLPRSLPPPLHTGRVEIRCEIIMSKSEFQRANANSDRSNARNWCAGLLLSDESKLQSKSDVELPKLALFVYGLLDCSADTHTANMQLLRASGFHVNHLQHSFEVPVVPKDTPASDQAWLHAIETARHVQIDFDTDGVVFKLDSVALQQQLSSTARAPRWAVAFKWPTVQATTTLLSVDLQVGNHGRLTPVANLAPVKIDGVVVKRATLHNIASALKADLRVGQTIKVQRAGGVIPQVVVPPHNNDASGESVFARHRISATALRCPCALGCAVEIDPLQVNATCTHPKCRPRAEQLIIHFCSKSAGVNIEGMGDACVKALMDAGLVGESVVDVFALVRDPQASAATIATVSELPRWGTKKAENLVNAIIKARNEASGDHLLAALGVATVGRESARVLLNHFKSLPAIAAASVEQMVAVHGVGDITAQELHDYFSAHPQLLTDLAEVGVKAAAGELLVVPTSDVPPRTTIDVSSDETVTKKSNIVAPKSDGDAALAAARSFCAGKSFVLTRAFVTVPRAEFSRILTSFGGQVKSQVTGATSYLIVGNAGKEVDGKKITEAQKRGTRVLSESELLQHLQIPDAWWKSQSM